MNHFVLSPPKDGVLVSAPKKARWQVFFARMRSKRSLKSFVEFGHVEVGDDE